MNMEEERVVVFPTFCVFNGTNYFMWKQRTRSFLAGKGALAFIEEGLEVLQEEHTVVEGDHVRDRARKERAQRDLRDRDAALKDLVLNRIADSVAELVFECVTVKDLWDLLQERYGTVTLASQMHLLIQYKELAYNPQSEGFKEYCSKFDKLVRQLKECGELHSDRQVVAHFLLTLPPNYSTVVTSIQVLDNGSNSVSMNFVRTKVEEFELTRKNAARRHPKSAGAASSASSSAAAFSGQHESRGRYRSRPYPDRSSNRAKVCSNCGYTNHLFAECRREGGGAYRGGHRGGHGGHRGGRGAGRGRGGAGRGGHRGGRGGGYQQGSSAGSAGSKPESANLAMDNDKVAYSCFAGVEFASEAALLPEKVLNTVSMFLLLVKFFLDSGASAHMVRPDTPVSNVKRLADPIKIQIAKSKIFLYAHSKGTLKCKITIDGVCRPLEIEVLIVENLAHNLLSIPKLTNLGLTVTFERLHCTISKNGINLARGFKTVKDLYELEVSVGENEGEVSLLSASEEIWHKRLGHLNDDSVKDVSKLVDGMVVKECGKLDWCEACIKGKLKKFPFVGTRPPTTRPLERVHSDVCGPVKPPAYDGSIYIVTFIDDYTHFTVAYGMKHKSEVFSLLELYEKRATSRFPGYKICQFRCDNGGEYFSNEMKQFFNQKGIECEPTIPRTSPNNGVAERMNQTLFAKVRCMLFGSNVRRTLWIEALMSAVYLLNRCPTRAVEGKTPAELWFGKRPNLSHLRVFGCVAYVHDPLAGKVDPKAVPAIMLGYCPNGYRVWSLEQNKVISARNVVFNEKKFRFDNLANWVFAAQPTNIRNGEPDPLDLENYIENPDEIENVPAESDEESNSGRDEDPAIVPEPEEFIEEQPHCEPRRSTRIPIRPKHLQDYVQLAGLAKVVDNYTDACINVSDASNERAMSVLTESESAFNAMEYCSEVPSSYADLCERADRQDWQAAVEEELNSLIENGTWEIVPYPYGKTPIKCKWVFTVKHDGDGNVTRHKARLVVKGCSQKEGIDYSETYAPVAKFASVRVLLCLINKENLHSCQLDVKNAFLNGVLKEEIYMCPPEGLPVSFGSVCKLRKTLYGLKQAPMEWNRRFSDFVVNLGFKQCQADRCIYVKIINSKCVVYLLLYVDDFLMACNSIQILNDLKGKFMREFKMRDLGEVNYFLGTKIARNSNGMFLSQELYIQKVLHKFKMSRNLNPCQTPLEVRPNQVVTGKSVIGVEPYREVIGSLMYACMSTRPDICTAVNFYSQFQTNATEEQWKGLKRVFRYLYGTQKLGLWFKGNSLVPLKLYVDADYANAQDRKSITGFVIEMFGDPILWGTRKQTCVAKSTSEAEFIALATAVSEVLWLKQLLSELGIKFPGSIPVFEDNTSCISNLKSWDCKRLKHIDIKYNFVKDLYAKKVISVEYIASQDQKADIMTKGLPFETFSKHRDNLSMTEC